MKILIVEDDKSAAKALPILLKHYGFDSDTVHTVQEALDYLDCHKKGGQCPDYMILDLMLPDCEKYKKLERTGLDVLRKVQKDNIPTTVIIATGMDNPSLLIKAQKLKPVAVLRKPIDIKELIMLFNDSKHDLYD